MRLNRSNNKLLQNNPTLLESNSLKIQVNCILSLSVVIVLFALLATLVNCIKYQYPGNNYFPKDYLSNVFTLLLMYGGFVLQFGRTSKSARILKECMCLFLIMLLLALATNSAQYTPFAPIDHSILALEASLNINLTAIVSWTHTHPTLVAYLTFIYESLSYQLCYIPLIIIAAQRFNLLYEYYFLLIISALLGFSFYYFFPTTAPASVIHGDFFSAAQIATGVKFQQIHHHILPYTLDGGLVALPSFHVIWAWLCLYVLRCWKVAFFMLLPINILLTGSCVLLGWHYTIDLFGSVVIILISHSLYYVCVTRAQNTWGNRNVFSIFTRTKALN